MTVPVIVLALLLIFAFWVIIPAVDRRNVLRIPIFLQRKYYQVRR